MTTTKMSKCPCCGANSDELFFSTYVDMCFPINTDENGNLVLNSNAVYYDITERDIVEGIVDDEKIQEIHCRSCGSIFSASLDYENDDTVLCEIKGKKDIG